MGLQIYLLRLKLIYCYHHTFMKHPSSDALAMFKCDYSSYLGYARCLIIVFPKYSEATCNSPRIIPAKNMYCILIIIIQILIYTVLLYYKYLRPSFLKSHKVLWC